MYRWPSSVLHIGSIPLFDAHLVAGNTFHAPEVTPNPPPISFAQVELFRQARSSPRSR